MSDPQTPLSAERKKRPQSSYVGSRNSRMLNQTQPLGLGVNGESKVISVRDLFAAKEETGKTRNMNATSVQGDNRQTEQKSVRPDSGLQSAYITPKHLYGYFDDRDQGQWANPKSCLSKEKKLDYISLFGEVGNLERNLVKIYAKRKHDVPGPQAYDMTPKWVYDGAKQRRCKFLPTDRVTDTEQTIRDAKRAKTPGPNHYKKNHSRSSREKKIIGTIKSNQDQLQMFNDRAYHAQRVPGHKYKFNHDSVEPKTKAFLYYPRTKPEGSGPAPKKKEKEIRGPGTYNIKYGLVENRQAANCMFTKTQNKNFIERYTKSKAFCPGIGRYKDAEKGYASLSRPVSASCTSRRRVG